MQSHLAIQGLYKGYQLLTKSALITIKEDIRINSKLGDNGQLAEISWQ